MAHVQKRQRGGEVRWVARFPAPDGSERSKTFDRKVDAERWLADQEAERARGTWTDPALGKVSVGEWAERWLDSKRRIKAKTRRGYRSLLDSRILPAFEEVPLGKLERVDVERWVGAMVDEGLSASRIRQAHQCLGAVLDSAMDNGYVGRNVARRVELPRKDKPEHRFYTAAQVAAFAESGDDQHRVIAYVLAYGGLRWSELVALRRGRCDLLRHRLLIAEGAPDVAGELVFDTTKTGRDRWVQLPAFVVELLAAHLETVDGDPNALVFTAPQGGPLRYSNYRRKMWDPARERAGLPDLTPHDLRHTCASLMRANGADVKAIQSQLGHSSSQVTLDTYTHLFEHALDGVMDAMEASRVEAAATLRRDRDGTGTGQLRRIR